MTIMAPIPPDTTPTREELLDEVDRLRFVAAGVQPVRRTVTWVDGRVVIVRDQPEPSWPEVGSPRWWAAPAPVRIASLLGLSAAYLVADPDQQVRERMRQVSHAISEGMSWSDAAHSLAYEPHRVLVERRGEPGPLARQVDPAALARWVATGNSKEDTAA